MSHSSTSSWGTAVGEAMSTLVHATTTEPIVDPISGLIESDWFVLALCDALERAGHTKITVQQ